METLQYHRREKALPRITRYHFFYWLIWPFGALIHSLKHFRSPRSKTLFWMFCIYFGFVFIYDDPFALGGSDSARYAANLIELHKSPFSVNSLFALLYAEGGYVDIYQPLATWLVSLFTGDPRWLFALFSAVFGFFYAGNIWIVLNRIQSSVTPVLFLYLLMFALINPLWNINGVRMWTAAQIFLYGILHMFLLDKNKTGWIWCSLSVLFHFSFMFPLAILLAYRFLPKSVHLYFFFYIGASFLSEINLTEVRNLLSFMPDIFQPRIESYTNEAYSEAIADKVTNLSWHVLFAQNAGKYVLYAWIISLYLNYKKWIKDVPLIKMLFIFALFLGGWAQIASSVPSGGRFLSVANSIFYIVIILLLARSFKTQRIYFYAKILAVPLIFVLVFQIRVGFDYMGLMTVAGNPLLALFFEIPVPLIEFVKSLL